jgi:hypothetical protein
MGRWLPGKTARTGRGLRKIDYVSTAGMDAFAPKADSAVPPIGIPIWRLRRAAVGDEQVSRLLVPEMPSSSPAKYVQKRLRLDEPGRVRDRIRVSVSLARGGHAAAPIEFEAQRTRVA